MYKVLKITDDPLRVCRLVVKYFSTDEIHPALNCDIRLRDSAKAALAKARKKRKKK